MKKAVYSLLICLGLLGAFFTGAWYKQSALSSDAALSTQRILYYVDPMHPAYKSQVPGVAPDCGMPLEPVYEDSAVAKKQVVQKFAPSSTAVYVSPEKQQIIGVKLGSIERASGGHTLRALGRVVPDETRIYKLTAGISGFVREVSAITTGSEVAKDQWLSTFSSPDIRSPIQGFLVTLDTIDRQKQGGADAPTQINAANGSSELAEDRLLNLGMSAIQIEEIRRTRQVPTEIRTLAPAAGFVLARNVTPGLKFDRGMELYRIANLDHVWILADIFENEAQYLRPGMHATVSLPGQSKMFAATVSGVLPQFDASSRTLKLRLEVDNRGYFLRPEMFVDVQLPVSLPAGATVPADAVIDSGREQTVFVDLGNGFFEPRTVRTGWRFADRVEIVDGLNSNEKIVVSGNFLLGAEARLRSAQNGTRRPDEIQAQAENQGGQVKSGHPELDGTPQSSNSTADRKHSPSASRERMPLAQGGHGG